MFVDRVVIHCVAGKGGNGAVAWRREKYIPKGGPSGGNGGKGGSIKLIADHNVMSLESLRNRRQIRADNGAAGTGGCKQGKNGVNLEIKVPCGTLVKDSATHEVLYDLTRPGDSFVLCAGGKGGRGNFSFRTSTNRSPNISTPGLEGESKEVELELKIIADVGLVGLPNSGKSTLISSLAHVKVKIAPYPFTTLQPNVGFVYTEDGNRVLLADIPGIIEGAHANKGLGYEFLRHIERTKVLLFVVDAGSTEGRDPREDFKILQQELKKYDPELLKKPYLICLNKIDVDGAMEHIKQFKLSNRKHSKHIYLTSALDGEGLASLKKAIIDSCQLICP